MARRSAVSRAAHVDGDVLVQIDFENGGANPVLRVYEWQGGLTLVSTGGACTTAGDNRCAVAATSSTNPDWSFDDKFTVGANNDIPAGGFVEGGINLTALGLDDGCVATFLAETRSSPSPDSTLSDFAAGSFNLCVAPDISTQVKNDQNQGTGLVTINSGESVTDTVLVSGTKGVAQGTVDFFVCGPTNSAQDCTTGGTPIGADIALNAGAATSSVFTPTAKPTTAQPDFYCFRVEYTPAAGSKYTADEHTNSTTECVRVIPADVRIIKTPDAGTVNAGEAISFTLQWGNVGEGKATGVVVTDNLPGTRGLNWSIDSSKTTGTGSTCAHRRRRRLPGPDLQRRLDQRQHAGPAGRRRRQHQEQRLGDRHERDDAGLLRRHRQHRRDHVGQRRHQPEPRSGDRAVPGRQRREDAGQRPGECE